VIARNASLTAPVTTRIVSVCGAVHAARLGDVAGNVLFPATNSSELGAAYRAFLFHYYRRADFERRSPMLWLALGFFALVAILGRRVGVLSLRGVGVGLILVTAFVVRLGLRSGRVERPSPHRARGFGVIAPTAEGSYQTLFQAAQE
jgi:hypothetical protein